MRDKRSFARCARALVSAGSAASLVMARLSRNQLVTARSVVLDGTPFIVTSLVVVRL
jgi:hypothetical protein